MAVFNRHFSLAEDGMIEALELEDPDFFMLAVQFHPEWHVDDGSDEFLSFFTMLMDAAAAGN
ncbi:MAG: gamma-glutamyl-gamma-aminobutyrate hydrolase family protein [Clostridia bacterium]|nr:gamma-glutamyl-gamma-aminobutyrate hydrolase family protein [Clostridia bacterium]